MCLIFMRNVSLRVSLHDITYNCDVTGSFLLDKHGIIKEVTKIQQKVKT